LEFSIFELEKIRPEKFRGTKDPVVQTFGLEIFGWKKFWTVRA
jgi:hypothetical protein